MDETTTVESEQKPVCEKIMCSLHCYFIYEFYGWFHSLKNFLEARKQW